MNQIRLSFGKPVRYVQRLSRAELAGDVVLAIGSAYCLVSFGQTGNALLLVTGCFGLFAVWLPWDA